MIIKTGVIPSFNQNCYQTKTFAQFDSGIIKKLYDVTHLATESLNLENTFDGKNINSKVKLVSKNLNYLPKNEKNSHSYPPWKIMTSRRKLSQKITCTKIT